MDRKWFRLDNAALIFPAIHGRKWSNCFRLSAELNEPVDPEALARAARDLQPRFPTFFVRMRTGMFWHYLEEIPGGCRIQEDYAYPLTYMSRRELRTCCLRILYYRNSLAAEFYHSVTDGTGGLIFLQNLIVRYLEIKHGITVSRGGNVADLSAQPSDDELRDCFQLHHDCPPAGRGEANACRLRGTPEKSGFRHLITGSMPADALRQKAHQYGVTVTVFLAAVLTEAIAAIQRSYKTVRRPLPVKITVPVDLRRLYGEHTLRNFILPVNIGIDPRKKDYTLQEICTQLKEQLTAEAAPGKMEGRIAANVGPQRDPLLRIVPLPVKELFMRGVYDMSGERKGSITLSNLGQTSLPREAAPYVRRLDFIIGVQRIYPNNCSVISCGGTTRVNMIRKIREPELERRFFSHLAELGIPVEIESNERQ